MQHHDHNLQVNKIAIIGTPNVGKSSLFNQITRSYSLVANLPHTTIEIQRAPMLIGGKHYEIIDTPGIQSLNSESEDSLVTRSILLEEHPEIIVLCLDATNVKRSLQFAAQIFELDIPLVVCLNFTDESRQKGLVISRKKLEALLGVPVIETVAAEGRGIKELLRAFARARTAQGATVRYKHFIETCLDELSACFPEDAVPSDGILLLLLTDAPGIQKYIKARYGEQLLAQVQEVIKKAHERTNKDLARIILEERSRWADRIMREVVEEHAVTENRWAEAFGMLSRHPFWGWVILLLVIYGAYFLVGKIGIAVLVPFFEDTLFEPLNQWLEALLPWQLVRELLIGDYGIFTTGLENAIGTVLPILSMFFIILNILEDTGYIANLCVLTNRIFHHFGLSGRSILPLMLGFGCRTMAVLTTQILDSRKERCIAIFLIAFAIPCAPLLGVMLAILAMMPFAAFVLVFGVLGTIEVLAGIALNRLIPTDKQPEFIIEIPPVRLPRLKNLAVKTYYRLKWFSMEAIPLFVIGAFLLFVMDKLRVLLVIKQLLNPLVVSFLHLPISMVDVFFLSLLRLEAGAAMVLKMAQHHELDPVQIIVSLIVITAFVPCFANIMAMIKMLGLKTAAVIVFIINASAFAIGGLVSFILRSTATGLW